MLRVEQLNVRFGQTVALQDISFAATAGQITGVTGASGAGKTSLLRAIAGTIAVSSGRIHRPAQVGYVAQEFGLYGDLTADENLRFFARLYGVKDAADRIRQLLTWVGLAPFASRLAGQFSGGMKQKLSIAAALVAAPPLLLLDEPTAGVDPVSRQELWELLQQQAAAGRTIVCSTQYLEEIAQMQQVLLLHRGRCLALGDPAQLLAAYPHSVWRLADAASLRRELRPRELAAVGITAYWRGNDLIVISRAGDDPGQWPELASRLPGRSLQRIAPGFEDLYVSYQEGETAWQ